MSTFSTTINPTPFAFFDSDTAFQNEADGLVTFVKRKLGDDILSVELTKKQIWMCLEEASLEYSKLINEMQIKSQLTNILGQPTGSADYTNKYPRQTMEFLQRQAEPYSSIAGYGGSYDQQMCYLDVVQGQQDYDIYSTLKEPVSGTNLFNSLPSGSKGKIKIVEVFHFSPFPAQSSLLNASNITQFLATNFNYESYVNSSVFYVLPVFEDVLRRGMLKTAFNVRRSNYSYDIVGRNLRIYPIPSMNADDFNRLYIKITLTQDPLNPAYQDDSIYGISGPQNAPFSNIPFKSITSAGRQWIRQYALALAKEVLGQVRSKFKSVPIPNAELTLNGTELVSQAREDKEKLRTEMLEYLSNFTNDKLAELDANRAEQIAKQLKYVPMALGKAVFIG